MSIPWKFVIIYFFDVVGHDKCARVECLRENYNIPLALINYECMELKQNGDDILWTIR